MYTDSVPLIAIPLKYVSFLLPNEFQYFGIWILAAFVLQAWFAWKIISRFVSNLAISLFGVVLFTNAPTLVYRMVHDGAGHIGFIGQFLILWSMYLYFDRDFSQKRWIPLLGLSPLICLGLVPMVFAVYVGRLLGQLTQNSVKFYKRIINTLQGLVNGLVITFGVMWGSGALMVGDPTGTGFGRYRTSLTSLFDPKVASVFSFSKLIPDLGGLPGSEEGFAFLGIVVLGLLAMSLPLTLSRQHPFLSKHNTGLIFTTIAMGVFSLSNHISIMQREVFAYPLPDSVLRFISPFRSSGRFVWPLVYILILFGLISLSEIWKKHRYFGYLILASFSLLQFIDTRDVFTHTQKRFGEIGFTPRLTSSAWDSLAQRYDHLVVIPPLNNDPGWFELALLANKWGLSSNAAFLARIDQQAFDAALEVGQSDLQKFSFDLRTLYVITNYPPNPMSDTILDEFGSRTNLGTKVFTLDGFLVVAPG
jgi:hypothetical protein